MGTTPKGVATSRRILDAAWELSDERGAEVVLGGVTLREIAARVDMAPSAVAYHFPTMGQLAVAMIDHLVETVSLLPVEATDELVAQVAHLGAVGMIRLAAQTNWDLLSAPDEIAFERRLARCYAATGDSGDSGRATDIIAAMTRSWVGTLAEVYRRAAETMDLRPIEPFTFEELARGAAALTAGMLNQWLWDPAAVRSDLVADLLVAIFATVLVPTPQGVTLAERAAQLPGPLTPNGGVLADDLALAVAAAPLFGAGVGELTLSEVGRALGIGPESVKERFGSIEKLAALSFHRHLGPVTDATTRRAHLGPAVGLTDGVYELARAALGDPHCSLALLHERQRTAMSCTSDPADRDIRSIVPLSAALSPQMCELVDCTDLEAGVLADLVVDTTLGHASTNPRRQISRIAETVLRLVPADF